VVAHDVVAWWRGDAWRGDVGIAGTILGDPIPLLGRSSITLKILKFSTKS